MLRYQSSNTCTYTYLDRVCSIFTLQNDHFGICMCLFKEEICFLFSTPTLFTHLFCSIFHPSMSLGSLGRSKQAAPCVQARIMHTHSLYLGQMTLLELGKCYRMSALYIPSLWCVCYNLYGWRPIAARPSCVERVNRSPLKLLTLFTNVVEAGVWNVPSSSTTFRDRYYKAFSATTDQWSTL